MQFTVWTSALHKCIHRKRLEIYSVPTVTSNWQCKGMVPIHQVGETNIFSFVPSCWIALWSRCWWSCPGSSWRRATGLCTTLLWPCVWGAWGPWWAQTCSPAETKDPVRKPALIFFLLLSQGPIPLLLQILYVVDVSVRLLNTNSCHWWLITLYAP